MLSHALRAKVQNGTIPTNSDPNFKQVSLLLHGDGTNGAQNNTFLDSSTNNFTVTRNGNTTQGTNTPFSQAAGYWSNYFDGTGDYLNIADNANLELPTQDFTIECFAYFNAFPAISTISVLCQKGLSTNSTFEYQLSVVNIGNTNFLRAAYSTDGATVVPRTTGTVLALNTWYHFAITRVGTTVTFWLNGVNIGTNTWATTGFTGTGSFAVGANSTPINLVNGYISNLRILKGTALYTTAFTPPTAPLTAVTNTQLLTCQSNNFKDNSSNNFTITRNGDTSVQPFSPFAPTAAYSTSVNGGSMYFDGTGDSLSTPYNAATDLTTGNFTVEGWFYLTKTNTRYSPIINATSSNVSLLTDLQYFIGLDGTTLIGSVYSGNTSYPITFTSISVGAWHHFALVRNGTAVNFYLNGVQNGTTQTVAGALHTNSFLTKIGYYSESGIPYYFNGYVSNTRIVKGTAVYTATFTPPTAPLTAISGTQLLLNGTNAGIFDNAAKNDLETVGNAQVSTAVTKFGTGSVYIPAGGALANYVTTPNSPQFDLGTGDFTIEFWYNAGTNVANTGVLTKGWGGGGYAPFLFYHTGTALQFYSSSNNSSWDIVGGANIISSVSTGTWYHVAVTRQGSSIRTFSNGTLISTTTSSAKLLTNTSPVTMNYHTTLSQGTTYIDDLRITKGVARYTANFTPPTAAFPNQ